MQKTEKAALPKTWITPIRLFIYTILAACSAYIYFNARELEFTHYIIFVSITAVSAMVLLDCKMSRQFWDTQAESGADAAISASRSSEIK